METVSRVVADDWICIAPSGQTLTKEELLEMLSARPSPFDTTEYSEVAISLFGHTAVVTSFFQGAGRELELKQRFMRVYAKRDENWRCVTTQIVPVPDDPRA